jgi:predicted nucleotidyltransferase
VDRRATSSDSALRRFARQLRQEIDASQVLLFGSRARGQERGDSDYDVIVVADRFQGIEPMRRAIGLRQTWYRVGGNGPMDLICLTPEELVVARERISLVAAVLPEAIDLLSVEPIAVA